MPSWPRSAQAVSSAATSIVTTTETVLATLPPVSTDGSVQRVQLQAFASFTTGAGTTGYTLRIRRGTGITGTVVATSGIIAAAASTLVAGGVDGLDAPGEVADQQYVLTVQLAGATGNGTGSLAGLQGITSN